MVAHDVDIEGNGNIRGISLSKSEGLHVPSISASTHAGEDETNIPATQSSPEPDGLDENSNAELRENGFIKLNTHDTSFVEEHIPDIEKFAQDLQQAINAAWSDRKRNRYQEVHVLLLSWEDDNMGVFREIERLRYVFSNLYRFDVQEFRIPGKTPQKAATVRLSSFLEKDGPSSLLIVYYAGHARLGPQSSAPPIWAATDKIGTPTLPSGSIQGLLEEAESDVLLLYDSCHSSHPAVNIAGQGVTEVIAACGFETRAPAVGPHSFTNALIRELEEAFAGPPISVAELHGRVIGSLKNWKPSLLRNEDGSVWVDQNGKPKYECHKRRTPVHCFLTNEAPYRSIMLAPLSSTLTHEVVANIEGTSSMELQTPNSERTKRSRRDLGEGSSTDPTTLSESSKNINPLEVLLAVRLEDDFFLDDQEGDEGKKLRSWCDWLKSVPKGAKDVKIQGIYNSCSTLILLSLPVVLWDLLPRNAAYSFIGFVNSDNLAGHLLSDQESSAGNAKLMDEHINRYTDIRIPGSRKSGYSENVGSKIMADASTPNDISKSIMVYSVKDKKYIDIKHFNVHALSESWISNSLVDRLGLKPKIEAKEQLKYGYLGYKTFEFQGNVTLQLMIKGSGRTTAIKCRVIPDRASNLYLESTLFSLPAQSTQPTSDGKRDLITQDSSSANSRNTSSPAAEKPEEKPIRFLDAIGREFYFPFHVAKTREGMEGLIKSIFVEVERMRSHIEKGNYELREPSGRVISLESWESVVQSGWVITMHAPLDQSQSRNNEMVLEDKTPAVKSQYQSQAVYGQDIHYQNPAFGSITRRQGSTQSQYAQVNNADSTAKVAEKGAKKSKAQKNNVDWLQMDL